MDITGLLYSQIGYDLGDPMRALVRSTNPDYIKEGAYFEVLKLGTCELAFKGSVNRWGEKWGSTWWEMDFSDLNEPGEYRIVVKHGDSEVCASDGFKVAENLLWDETIRVVALDQLEERAALARNGIGWKDCGSNWREVNSHATTIIGLCDLLNIGFQWMSPADVERLKKQIIHGCDYIAICQDKAERLGFPKGAIIHEIPNHMVVITGDVAQSVVALARSSRLLADTYPEKSDEYLKRAASAYEFLLREAQPYGPEGFSHMNHGAPQGFNVPREWMTRDLLMMMWGGIELWAAGKTAYREDVVGLARKVMSRQVPKDRKEGDFYGHFYTFDHCQFTEKANIHHHVGHDTGGTFPHYIIPFMEMCSRWYDHPDATLWRQTVKDFAYGYFLPACRQNPFYLVPEGYFTGEGVLVFCGPWHGINTTLAFGATLAVRLEGFTGDREFRNIAVGNVQWIAGLNAGITADSFKGCVKWKEDVPPGVAEPYSQIYGVGRKYVGNWTGIKGTIPNGFSVNPQFQLVVEPTKENDGPWLYTDEDWIPHAAGWVSALTHLRERKFFAD